MKGRLKTAEKKRDEEKNQRQSKSVQVTWKNVEKKKRGQQRRRGGRTDGGERKIKIKTRPD